MLRSISSHDYSPQFPINRYFPEKPLLGIHYALVGGTVTFGLIPFLASYGKVYCSALLLLAGAANCGPDSLLTGSVTMTIGERYGTSSGAGVTSLVNGVGSVGAIIEGPLVGLISQVSVGWNRDLIQQKNFWFDHSLKKSLEF